MQAQNQIKLLQKKVKDLANESRSKKQRMDELESQAKINQDKLQKALDDAKAEARKAKHLEEEIAKLRKSSDHTSTAANPRKTAANPSDVDHQSKL